VILLEAGNQRRGDTPSRFQARVATKSTVPYRRKLENQMQYRWSRWVFALFALAPLSTCNSHADVKATVHAEPEPTPEPAPVFDRAPIDRTLQAFVDRGQIAGASALVFKDGKEIYFGAFGFADREAGRPMTRDTLVQIFSMTKPITGVAFMQLHEQGKFELGDDLATHAAEFADVKVYGGATETGQPILETPHRPISIADITRHTAGFASSGDSGLGLLVRQADATAWTNTLSDMARILGSTPLGYHPGEQWLYSPAVDVQAFLTERLSGVAFDEYVQTHILDPLGMKETSYYVAPERRGRLAAEYRTTDDGKLERVPDEEAYRFNSQHWPMKPGGFGLTSTIDDYAKFARMLLNDGELDGVRILASETVHLMATNHLSETITERSWLPNKGHVGFGIDFAVRLGPPTSADENPGVVGEFFWDGAASTLFWVDPHTDMVAVLFVQLFPFDRIGLHRSFRGAVYEAIGGLKQPQ